MWQPQHVPQTVILRIYVFFPLNHWQLVNFRRVTKYIVPTLAGCKTGLEDIFHESSRESDQCADWVGICAKCELVRNGLSSSRLSSWKHLYVACFCAGEPVPRM